MVAIEPVPGTLHTYLGRHLSAFEYATANGVSHQNVVLFVGGLGDGFRTVEYVYPLAQKLDKIGWSVVEVLTSSSYAQWGTGSLQRDNEEISKAIEYFQTLKRGKIVLAGHSTGCQDTISYVTKFNPESEKPMVNGAILQAPVSDREAMRNIFPGQFEDILRFAKQQVGQGKGEEILPKRFNDLFFGAPITARRWVSLADKLGDDDFFSSDLDDHDLQATFGKVNVPLLVLYSGADQFVPDTVDKKELVSRWRNVTPANAWSKHGGIIEGATHAIDEDSKPGARQQAIGKIVLFLSEL
ncbi:hypothetical protein V1514DRAFT_335606 [Lipomyces japonicus]|uniref:uncharacterized protein n=1 Tax=Lipomyces japonicus TaxID=56871 RepID=UPI0034CF2E2A